MVPSLPLQTVPRVALQFYASGREGSLVKKEARRSIGDDMEYPGCSRPPFGICPRRPGQKGATAAALLGFRHQPADGVSLAQAVCGRGLGGAGRSTAWWR